MRRVIKGNIYTKQFDFSYGELAIDSGRVCEINFLGAEKKDEVYIIPGLVDIHMHGAMGIDVCSASVDELKSIAEYEKKNGITSFCPTTMTLKESDLYNICKQIGSLNIEQIVGINLEGPFISREKCGAQNKDNVLNANNGKMVSLINELQEASNGMIKLVTVAPEESGVIDGIKELKNEVHVSLGHTVADYDVCMQAFDAGADHVTHLYNAMSYVNHREPGLLGAAMMDDKVFVEIICDGEHIHPSIVKSTFKTIGEDRIVLISDSIEATGCENGNYMLGDLQVVKNGNKAVLLSDATVLAGSVSNLYDCLKTAVTKMSIPFALALRASTYNPAKSIGLDNEIGLIDVGRKANILIVDNELNICEVL